MVGIRLRNPYGYEALQNVFLYKRKIVSFDAPYIRIAKFIDVYEIFTVKLLHFFHHGISKQLKECTAAYLSCEEATFKNRERAVQRHLVRSFKNIILDGCNNVLSAYEKEIYISRLHVNFPQITSPDSGMDSSQRRG